MENWWETWKFGCPVYCTNHHDLHTQLEIMLEPFWGWGGTSVCCVGQVFLRHILLWLSVRTPSVVPAFDLLAQGHLFSAGWWGAGSDLITHSAAAVGLLSMPVPGQQSLQGWETPLSENWGKKKKICLAGVELMCKIALLAHWWICFCRMDNQKLTSNLFNGDMGRR